MTAWPMSRMFTPPCASTPVMAAVRPGRSSPVILIRTISRKASLQAYKGSAKRRSFYPHSRALFALRSPVRNTPGQSGNRPQRHGRRFAGLRPLVILHDISIREEPRSVNRPVQVKPDNFFLLLFNALRQRRVPLALRIASHSLLLVALALLLYAWVMGMQFKQ